MQFDGAIADRNALMFNPCGGFFAPEIGAEIPFAFVQGIAVKFIMPDELPFFIGGQQAFRMIGNGIFPADIAFL